MDNKKSQKLNFISPIFFLVIMIAYDNNYFFSFGKQLI